MQIKNFTKAGVSFIAVFAILMVSTCFIMSACQSSVNPTSAGIATFTPTPKVPTSTSTATNTANLTATPLPAGSIAFVAFLRNGATGFAFVNTGSSNILANTTIYFTNYCYDGSVEQFKDESISITGAQGVTAREGTISYTIGGSGLAPWTPVIVCAAGNQYYPDGGTVTYINGFNNTGALYFNKNGEGDKLYAYMAGSAAVAGAALPGNMGFLAAINLSSLPWQTTGTVSTFYQAYLPQTSNLPAGVNGLTAGNSIDLSPLWTNAGAAFAYPGVLANQSAILGTCISTSGLQATPVAAINTGTGNWFGITAGGGTFALNVVATSPTPNVYPTVCTAGNVGYTIPVQPTVTVVPY